MTKHLSPVRIVSAFTATCLLALGLVGCTHDAFLVRSGKPGIHEKVGEDFKIDKGSTAGGVPAPTGGASTAALCFPSNSGPHQWPLNVYTSDEFYPSQNPNDTTVSVLGTHDAPIYVIKVKGTAQKP